MADTQSFKSHTRWDPIYHFFTIPILLANVIIVGIGVARAHGSFGFPAIWSILFAVAVFMVALKARLYALGAQDRVIRLEERLRLASMVPASEMAELDSLTMRQYIGLRFASDDFMDRMLGVAALSVATLALAAVLETYVKV